MRKVLITGASGFIGYQTVLEFINRGCFVYALVHNTTRNELVDFENDGKIKVVQSDVTDYASLKEVFDSIETPDVIVHCAGRASDVGWDKEFRKTNFESIQHLVKLTKEFDVKRFVFVSTTDVYGLRDFNGETEDELPYDKGVKNPYPKYKIKAEKWIKQTLSKQQYCIIRPAAVWGEDDPTLTPRIKDFLLYSPFIIHFGRWRGQNRWPLAHVNNVAIANYIGAFHPKSEGKAINVLDDTSTTMDDFYRFIAKEYFPSRKYKSITLPLRLGIVIGSLITLISNLLNLKKPFMDPSLYALYSVSSNLDFSADLFHALKNDKSVVED